MYILHTLQKCQILQLQRFNTNEQNISVHLTEEQIWHAGTNWTVDTALLLIVWNKTLPDPKLDCNF